MGMEKRGVCGMCHNKCDIVATLEHGRLVKVEADSKLSGEGSVPGERNRWRLCTVKKGYCIL